MDPERKADHWSTRTVHAWRIPSRVGIWFHSLLLPAYVQHRRRKDFAKYVGRAILGRRLVFPGPMGCCAFAHIILLLGRPRKYGPHGELFVFVIKKEGFALTEAVQFKLFVPSETLNACALIGLHLMAAEGESESSSFCGVFSPQLGGIPGLSGPMYPLWKDDVSCPGSESILGEEVYERNSECQAIEVIGRSGQARWWRSLPRIESLREQL